MLSEVIYNRSGNILSSQKIACPAGTLLEWKRMPLQQAVASHEYYVPMNTQFSLSASIRNFPHLFGVKPLVTQCGTNAKFGGYYTWEGTKVYQYVYIDRYSNCNMRIDSSTTYAYPIRTFLYWNRDQYAGWTGNWGCRPIVNSVDTEYPNTIQQAGYYYEQFYADGSSCTWFDNWLQLTLGQLS